jgi:small subunit ribosomal protein S20
MPIIKSAKKKLKQDVKRTAVNLRVKNSVKEAIKTFRKTPTTAGLSLVFKTIDSAAKKNVFHKNKADRLKSRLSHLVSVKKTT